MARIDPNQLPVPMPESKPILSGNSPSSEAEACPICDGLGWFVTGDYTIPVSDRLVRCECGKLQDAHARELDEQARRARLAAQLGDELGALEACTFESFTIYRPIPEAITWDDQAISMTLQRRALKNAVDRARQYASQPDPRYPWLYIHGSYGAGKSHLAAAICHERQQRGAVVRYRSVPGMLDALRREMNRSGESDLMQDLITCDLLVLDDIGTEHLTAWAEERLFRIINERQGKALILTSNLHPIDLQNRPDRTEKINARIGSRIDGNAMMIWMPIYDFRRLKDGE